MIPLVPLVRKILASLVGSNLATNRAAEDVSLSVSTDKPAELMFQRPSQLTA